MVDDLDPRRQNGEPRDGVDDGIGVGIQHLVRRGIPGIVGGFDIELTLDVPIRCFIHHVVVARGVAILDDAADLDIGKCEDTLLNLVVTAFLDNLEVWLACKGDDRAVRMNSTTFDIAERLVIPCIVAVAHRADERQLYIGVFLAILGEDLDAIVELLCM